MPNKLIILLILLTAASCRKPDVELVIYEANSHTHLPLHDVCFVNDSVGFACGGDKWTKGIFLRTTDGGFTWSQPDSIFNAACYTMHFFDGAHGIVAGNNSLFATTADSGKTFTVRVSDYRPINSISFQSPLVGVIAGGEIDAYNNGYLAYTTDGGNSLTRYPTPGNMTAIAHADALTVYASGFGAIYKSTDGGKTFQPLNARGDFFLALSAPSPNTAYFAGYQRLILKTTDAGYTFRKIMSGNAPFSPREHFRCISFADEYHGAVAGDNGIMYLTRNGGDTWERVKKFTSHHIRAIHLFAPDRGVVVTDGGEIFLFRN
ncbi:MAG: hypothetical protein RML37_05650 [Chitinophagales bacterium]|nr:hypothetical protein [Chitinophagales bacterium]